MDSGSRRVRVRTSSGVVNVELPQDATVADLRAMCASAGSVTVESLELLAGFPPRPVDLSVPNAPVTAVVDLNDTLTLRGSPAAAPGKPSLAPAPQAASAEASQPAAPPAKMPLYDSIAAAGTVIEKTVPDDNSCLFRSVAAVARNDALGDPLPLRQICARAVADNPLFYTRDVLQRSNPDYCDWICRPTAWGGPIELAILSDYFKMEISAWDVRSLRAERYGEGKYDMVGFLVYDGLHYNYMCLDIQGAMEVTQFPADDPIAREKAFEVVRAKHAAGKFTDVNNFRLKCTICGAVLRGEKAASDHGEATGHTSFTEIS